MLSRSLAMVVLASLNWACMINIAGAQNVRVMDLSPSAIDVMEGKSNEFSVRFDRPVDHSDSTLTIVRNGRVVEDLTPRLGSAPNVLFSRVPALASGEYMLHWSVKTTAAMAWSKATFPFRSIMTLSNDGISDGALVLPLQLGPLSSGGTTNSRSAPPYAPLTGTDMATGTVKWFNGTKGYGFIQPDNGGKDVFVHMSVVERAGLNGLNEGQKVTYEIQQDRGKEAAVNLKA